MPRLTKDALLTASDISTKEVELPSIGGSVLVQGLSAAYSNQASSEALEMTTTARGEQIAKVNTSKLEIIQAQHGLVDPPLSSFAEAETFAKNCGPAFKKVIEAIDELSGLDKEAITEAAATFPSGGESESGGSVDDGTPVGSAGPAVRS
jgi:hypothetical protein